MLWGRTLRLAPPLRPHPLARHRPRLAIPGVACVVTADDVGSAATYGLISADQPVFAADVVQFVMSRWPRWPPTTPTPRQALDAIVIDYDPAAAGGRPDRRGPRPAPIHPDGNVIREVQVRHGDPEATADVVVEGAYDVGMQDQAFLGPSRAWPCPTAKAASITRTPPSGSTTMTQAALLPPDCPRAGAGPRRRGAGRSAPART